MEQIIPGTVLRQVEDREEIEDIQYGFTKDRCCLINLVTFYDGVIASVDKRRATDVMSGIQ